MARYLTLILIASAALQLPAQDGTFNGREGRNLLLENFRPRPALKVPEHRLVRAKFPVVDVHAHFRIKLKGGEKELDAFVKTMDENNIALCISLDGQLGEKIDEHAKFLWTKYRDRFAVFANLDWQGSGKVDDPATWDCQRPDFARRMARELAAAKEKGACGLKIFKQFGLEYKNPDGSLIKIDDPRWDDIWRACGELGLPVLIHVADPAAFFQPIDEKNERWEELHRHPEWSFYSPPKASGGRQPPDTIFPKQEELFSAFLRVVKRHPKTTFISAHVANNAEDLFAVSRWLDDYANLHVELASRIGELGRQPVSTRKFLLKYQDRVLFGTDGPWPAQRLRLYWRFLETEDEYFPYSEKDFPPQGFWNIYGVTLPDEVLKKVYQTNAMRLVPGITEKVKRYRETTK